jgi:hypothetical protein
VEEREKEKAVVHSQAWWHRPVGTSTQEAEAGALRVPGQLGLHSETLSQKKKTKPNKQMKGSAGPTRTELGILCAKLSLS